MNRIFAITAASERVSVGEDGCGGITFTVTNSSARHLRGQFRVRPLGSTKGEWLSVAGETERAFSPNATLQVAVKVSVPPGSPAGKYQFRLDAISVDNPDDDFTEGPAVDLEVKATEAPKKAFPWWIVAAAAGGLILVVTLTWWLWPRGVEVPDVVGLNFEEAKKKIEDLNLKVEVTRQANMSVLSDHVFGQDPIGSSTVESGATVMLLVASQKTEIASKPAPPAAPVATPVRAPTPVIRTCAARVFRSDSERTWVEFRLPQAGPGAVVKIPGGARNKYVFPKCNRVWWDEVTFTCGSAAVWERTQGNWGADGLCHGSPSSHPYLASGDK